MAGLVPALASGHVILVHGYSVQLLNNYAQIPRLLGQSGIASDQIFLSAFVSLDDQISCDDLAVALESRVAALESSHGLDLRKTTVVTHSTGAIVARRWILNRLKQTPAKALPLHFISCAGANHGSSLAQVGQSMIAKIFREFAEHTSVGARVLDDLDYGSDFLRRLNGEWLAAWNDPAGPLSSVFCFSLGGADHSFWKNQLAWQAHETGSDGTVRISSANLNYRWIRVNADASGLSAVSTEVMQRSVPHLVVDAAADRYSHTSQSEKDVEGEVLSAAAGIVNSFTDQRNLTEPVTDNVRGILDGVAAATDRPFRALLEAMAVADSTAYDAVRQRWSAETGVWAQTIDPAFGVNPQVNSTIVVTLSDDENTPIHDSVILIKDQNGNTKTVSLSLEPHQPIYNKASPATMSFYVNSGRWLTIHPHMVSVDIKSGTPYAAYAGVENAPISDDAFHVVEPNEFTYIDLRVPRDTRPAYTMYAAGDPAVAAGAQPPYPPFPQSELFP